MLTPEQLKNLTGQFNQQYGSAGSSGGMGGMAPTPSSNNNLRGKDMLDSLGLSDTGEYRPPTIGDKPTPAQGQSNEPGFFSRVGTDIKKRFGEVNDTMEQAAQGNINPLEAGIQTVGKGVFGSLNDVLGEGIKSGLSMAPDWLKSHVSSGVQGFLDTGVGKAAVDAATKGKEVYDTWAQENPRAAKDIESVANIASFFPLSKGAQVAGTTGKEAIETAGKELVQAAGEKATTLANIGKGVKEVALPSVAPEITETAGKLGIDASDKAFQRALEVAKPVLNKSEKQLALETPGRVKDVGLLRTRELVPTPDEIRIANNIKNVVTGKNAIKDVGALTDEIGRMAEKEVAPVLKNIPVKDVSPFIDKLMGVELPTMFKADPIMERTYNLVRERMMDMVGEQAKAAIKAGRQLTMDDLWNARKEFDKIAKKEFPRMYTNPSETAAGRAIKDVRHAVNDFVGENVPNGGELFKGKLKQMNDMYSAIHNIGMKNIGSLGTNGAERFLSASPKLKKALKIGAGIGSAGGAYSLLNNFIGSSK